MNSPRLCLAFETSCDETSVAWVRDDGLVVHQLIASQIAEHRPYGGVVPELASRGHLRRILALLRQLEAESGVAASAADMIAVTAGPGLIGALLTGVETAKTLAWLLGKPVMGVHHLHGHLASIGLHDAQNPNPLLTPADWPQLALIVSGGHSSLVHQKHRHAPWETLGQTIDDAIGEAFDKVAKLLGLGYPGGPIIDRLCETTRTDVFALPRPMMDRPGYDFSYSGLKTAVLTHARRLTERPHELDIETKRLLCASFQEAAVDCLFLRLAQAIGEFRPASVAVVGGVACNRTVRRRMAGLATSGRIGRAFIPPAIYCTDNAAMIGAAAWDTLARPGGESALLPPSSLEAMALKASADIALIA